jgi:hypothetical protein
MGKTDHHELARFLRPNQIDPEIVAVLDRINVVARAARPLR